MALNIIFFLCSRFIMGIGAGGMGSLPYIIAGYVFKNIKTRTKVLGYLTASWNGAAILGPLVGGWLIDAFSWHWVFYINIPRSEEHTSELQSRGHLVCRLLLEKKNVRLLISDDC